MSETMGMMLDARNDHNRDAYTMQAECVNCQWVGSVVLSKGQLKPVNGERMLGRLGLDCPRCECEDVIRGTDFIEEAATAKVVSQA